MSDPAMDLYNFLSSLAGNNLLFFIFLVSLFGNIIPIVPIPYLLVVIGVATSFPSLGIIQIASVSALGASIGKFASWALGYGVRGAMSGSRARFDSLRRLLGGSVFLVGFIFAATPLPDDVALIPMGIMRYSPAKTFISLVTGKFVWTLFIVYTARQSEAALQSALGGGIAGSLLTVLIIALLSLIMTRVDWERVLKESQGVGLIRRMMRSGWSRLRRGRRESSEPRNPSG